MKRKFKLFATIASLCLCLALMAFGVYAATNVKYTASGSVSFQVNDVFVTVTNNMVKKIGAEAEAPVASTVESAKSYTEDGGVKAGTDLAADCTYGDVQFSKTGDYIKYTTVITNDGESAIKVKFVVTTPTDTTHLGATVTAQVKGEENPTPYTNGVVKTLGNKDTITLVLTISLKNMESTLTSEGSKWEVKGFASINETFAE